MSKFKLKVTLDPAKHNVPHEVAKKDPNGYTCGCVVSQAVNDALKGQVGKRFRRWEFAHTDTGIIDTTIKVVYADGSTGRYSAEMPEAFKVARETYDENRGLSPDKQEPIVGATRTFTFRGGR